MKMKIKLTIKFFCWIIPTHVSNKAFSTNTFPEQPKKVLLKKSLTFFSNTNDATSMFFAKQESPHHSTNYQNIILYSTKMSSDEHHCQRRIQISGVYVLVNDCRRSIIVYGIYQIRVSCTELCLRWFFGNSPWKLPNQWKTLTYVSPHHFSGVFFECKALIFLSTRTTLLGVVEFA